MSYLVDVDLLCAAAWQSHTRHAEVSKWLISQAPFFTCSQSQMGFLRVSMSPAYRVEYEDARRALAGICGMTNHAFLDDATRAETLPKLLNRSAITDAHLVTLASRNGLKLATLDVTLCRAAWAAGQVMHPLSAA